MPASLPYRTMGGFLFIMHRLPLICPLDFFKEVSLKYFEVLERPK
jgi:hypothetical protein